MPTFDFECQKCRTVFEFTRPFGSKKNPACPSCGNKKTEKLLTPPAIHFKGSGWYKTDSGSSAAPKAKPSEAKPSTPTQPEKKETKTETKPVEKKKEEKK